MFSTKALQAVVPHGRYERIDMLACTVIAQLQAYEQSSADRCAKLHHILLGATTWFEGVLLAIALG